MRIRSLELGWFRGSSHSARLECQGKSVAVYGANGAGKSSFADALEYIVTKGKVCHLKHEYSGKRQEKGIRNTHAPEDTPSRIDLDFQDDSRLNVHIEHNGTPSIEADPPSLVKTIQAWDLERFILRQDQVAYFIHARKGEKYSVLLPLLGLESLEQVAENLHQLRGALEGRSDLRSKQQNLMRLKKDASKYLPDLTPPRVKEVLTGLATTYIGEGAPGEFEALIGELEEEINKKISTAEPDRKRHVYLQEIHEERLGQLLEQLNVAEHVAAETSSELLDRRIAVLEPSLEFIEALKADQELVDCPACGREVRVADFEEHVCSELESLRVAREAREKAIAARQALSSAIKQLSKHATKTVVRQWLNQTRRRTLKEAIDRVIAADIDDSHKRWSDENWRVLSVDIPVIASKVESAVRRAPPATKHLIQDQKTVSASKHIPEINALENEITRIEVILSTLAQAEAAVRDAIKEKTEKTIAKVSADIQRLWAKLHPDEPIEEVRLYIPQDEEKAIDISLKFFGVDQPSPRLTLSEGHRNSLGLCIFLALVIHEEVEPRPIVLDDVVSSLDREHRGMLAKVLMEDLAHRQVILLTHDREWFSELRMRLPASEWTFKALRPWDNPEAGIQWARSTFTFDDARIYEQSHPEIAGNRVRAIMDTQMAIAAESLKLSVQYARGDRNDHRTCVEFLEHVISEAEKMRKRVNEEWRPFPAPVGTWKKARSLLISWANRASHGGDLSKSEAKELIDTCEGALHQFWCKACDDPVWISDQTRRKRLQCSCGDLQWRYG